ncbi:AraC family transcriptional regulator Rsp [Staphylococcus caprae]|uniref:AraC family transcriptional regulator Rsp n=1 Tax=Staphylococcus caprae TaxID=29380 RepID=UPI000319C310|nr:AraC family transcriptional regulator Rsp [Staphylococcus caprae]
MTCLLNIYKHHHSPPTRNINRIILMFSLTNDLKITINGETKDLDNHIAIINQTDIYYVNQSSNLVTLSIPVFYFYNEDNQFFKCYFDRHLLQSSGFVKNIILQSIHRFMNNEEQDNQAISKIIQTLYKESVIRYKGKYIPKVAINHPIFVEGLTYIHTKVSEMLSLRQVAQHCNISESYCSNLFVRYLNMNFKDYFTSLKVIHAIKLLLSTDDSINAISEHSGFSSHTNFTNQFKNYLGFSPKQFRSYISKIELNPTIQFINENYSEFKDLINQFEFNDQLATEITEKDIDQFNPKDRTKSSKAFIRFENFNELFQFVFNEYYDIDFSYLPQPVVFIQDISDIVVSHINFNLLNRCFEKLFEKDIGLAMKIKTTQQFEAINQVILSFLQSNQDYKTNKKLVKLMLVFDSESMSVNEIHLCHLKIKNKNREIRYGMTVEGQLRESASIDHTYDIMKRLNFDYYFIDIENLETKNLLLNKRKTYHHSSTHFENYKQFMLDSGISSTRFVYNNLSLKCFKYTNNGANPLQLSDLVCHLIALMRYGGGISYQLIDDDSQYISLFNSYGSPLPLMHIYKMVASFVDEPLEVGNNYLMSRKGGNYHFLLFNKINDRYLSDSKQKFIFKNQLNVNSLIIINTLNNEHGSIQNLLPKSKELLYIERSILEELDKCNHPKTELAVQEENHKPFQLTLKHDEVKYICIKPL